MIRLALILPVLTGVLVATGSPAQGQARYTDPVTPRINADFVELALVYLETGDRGLLQAIAATRAARHLATHAARVSLAGEKSSPRDLVERILTAPAIAAVQPADIRARLRLMEIDEEARRRCWAEAAASLPRGALSGVTLFLTVGYDIGVAVGGNASLNLAHPRFAATSAELWFYAVHELHHAGFQRFHDLPRLADIRTTHQLAEVIRYLTTMEGMAVYAAKHWREEADALAVDPDYVALLDPVRMAGYEAELFAAYRALAEGPPRPLVPADWNILERMSTGDRLWYRVGARMAERIDRERGRDVLRVLVVRGPAAFFEMYAELAEMEAPAVEETD